MKSILYVGMGIMFFGLMILIAIGGIVGLCLNLGSNPHGLTWPAFKERLPPFLALGAFLVLVWLLVHAVILIMRRYGAWTARPHSS